MAALTLELTTTPATIKGNINYYERPGGGDFQPQPFPMPAPPANANPVHIHDDQPWMVCLEGLQQNGAIFAALGGCKWQFKVIFEKLGSDEFAGGPIEMDFPLNPVANYTYPTQVINIRPGQVPVGEYHVYASLKLVDAAGLTPIAGVGQMGTILQVINA